MTEFTLGDLDRIIGERAASLDDTSYTRKLLGKGLPKIAQKVGEEAVETVIAALKGDRRELAGEAADLLYHLLVLLKAADLPLQDVMRELAGRTGRTGLEEKALRPRE